MAVERPTLEAIEAAAARIAPWVVRTPVVPHRGRSRDGGIHLKLETLQPIGSFKIRGVLNAALCLSEEARAPGLTTVSAGNTAQAVAWAGRHFSVPARSLMPEGAPQTKIDAVRALGGEPVLVPVEQLFDYMQKERWREEPWAYICPWTNPNLHAGHGSAGLEIAEDLPDLQTAFLPVGGGGLLCGVASALKAKLPHVRIVSVESESHPALRASLDADAPVSVPGAPTICDGVAVPYMTEEMFPVLRDLVDDAMVVPEAEVASAVRSLALEDHLVAEGAGALALAAALRTTAADRGTCVAPVTGGSIDREKLLRILEG